MRVILYALDDSETIETSSTREEARESVLHLRRAGAKVRAPETLREFAQAGCPRLDRLGSKGLKGEAHG